MIFKNVQTNAARAVYVRVIYLSLKGNFWWFERIIRREMNVHVVDTSTIRAVWLQISSDFSRKLPGRRVEQPNADYHHHQLDLQNNS